MWYVIQVMTGYTLFPARSDCADTGGSGTPNRGRFPRLEVEMMGRVMEIQVGLEVVGKLKV